MVEEIIKNMQYITKKTLFSY